MSRIEHADFRGGRRPFGAATLLIVAVVACGPTPASIVPSAARPTGSAAPPPPAATQEPSSPTSFDLRPVDATFSAVTALTSTGERLVWASDATIWSFTPRDARAVRVYEGERGALIRDLAAVDGPVVFSEQLGQPPGSWQVSYLSETASPPVILDSGVAKRGAPPTVAIDGRRIAWAGFDESSGSPRTFLRVAERPGAPSFVTLLDADIDDRLLWYPQLDGDTLWYASIDPDFEATESVDTFRIETIDLAEPSAAPVPFLDLVGVFEPVVTPELVAWKSVEPGMSALTWGEINVLDRRSGEQLLVASRGNHPSAGSRFVAFEEFFHRDLVLYDLATRRSIEIPEALPGGRGTLGVPAIAGGLLGFSINRGADKFVAWARLPS